MTELTDTPEAAIHRAVLRCEYTPLRNAAREALDALVAENARLTAELAEELERGRQLRKAGAEALRVANELRAAAARDAGRVAVTWRRWLSRVRPHTGTMERSGHGVHVACDCGWKTSWYAASEWDKARDDYIDHVTGFERD